MNLCDLLRGTAIDPEQVLVLRHTRRKLPKLNKDLPRLAVEEPAVYNAYQQTQTKRVEEKMVDAAYVASFIGHQAGKALFVGLYKNNGSWPVTREEYFQIPANIELEKYGRLGFAGAEPPPSVLWFDLVLMEICANLSGKLIIRWPPTELHWCRWALEKQMPILAVLKESALGVAQPNWDAVETSAEEFGNASDMQLPEEVPPNSVFVEGSVQRILVNAYERNQKARQACLDHFGYDCSVCGFEFTQIYGDIGRDYIHVHHLRDLASIGTEYVVDPIRDLRPVCPNCHAMLHRTTPTMSVEALQEIIRRRSLD